MPTIDEKRKPPTVATNLIGKFTLSTNCGIISFHCSILCDSE